MKLNKGFTLIELIVVMVVFLFVIGAAIGIFISIIKQQRAVLAEQEFLNQISYAEEHMSKALRMATAEVGQNCLSALGDIYSLSNFDSNSGLYRSIQFINQSASSGNSCQKFFFGDDVTGTGTVLSEQSGTHIISLTSSNLQINYTGFVVNGGANSCNKGVDPCVISGGDGKQPRVTILLNVSIPGENQSTGADCSVNTCPANQACYLHTHKCMPTKSIQTTVSQRNLNVNNGQ